MISREDRNRLMILSQDIRYDAGRMLTLLTVEPEAERLKIDELADIYDAIQRAVEGVRQTLSRASK